MQFKIPNMFHSTKIVKSINYAFFTSVTLVNSLENKYLSTYGISKRYMLKSNKNMPFNIYERNIT